MCVHGTIGRVTDTRGETLVETLVAILLSVLSILMLAYAIGTSSNIVSRSRGVLETYYVERNDLMALSDAVTDAGSVRIEGVGDTWSCDVDVRYRTVELSGKDICAYRVE